jgi:hypothetical protein
MVMSALKDADRKEKIKNLLDLCGTSLEHDEEHAAKALEMYGGDSVDDIVAGLFEENSGLAAEIHKQVTNHLSSCLFAPFCLVHHLSCLRSSFRCSFVQVLADRKKREEAKKTAPLSSTSSSSSSLTSTPSSVSTVPFTPSTPAPSSSSSSTSTATATVTKEQDEKSKKEKEEKEKNEKEEKDRKKKQEDQDKKTAAALQAQG